MGHRSVAMRAAMPPYYNGEEKRAFEKGWREGKRGVTPTPNKYRNAYSKGYWTAYETRTTGALKVCPPPMRHTQDQYRCHACGIVWDIDELRPPCESDDIPQPQGGNP